jgi:aspartate-semialdehyde dehydrogenase
VAFNVIPQVGEFIGANTEVEIGLLLELNRVLKNPVPVVSTAVYVPTFVGMSQCVTLDLEGVMTAQELRTLLEDVHNVSVIDNPKDKEYSTPYGTAETSQIYVSRIREDALNSGMIQFFVTCDNLKAGAAQEVVNRLTHCFLK